MTKVKTSGTTLVVEWQIQASAEEVFEALTEESQLQKWFCPTKRGFTADVKFEASVGATYRIDMIDPEGKVYEHKGIIKEVVPNQKIAFTWTSHVVEDTLVTIELEEKDKTTTKLTLTHEFKPSDKIEGHDEGWKELLENLAKLLTEAIRR